MNSWDDMAAHDLSPVAGPDEATRRQQTRNPYSPVMILLTLIATIGILAYSAFLLNPANRGDFLPYTIVIAAESILVLHALLAMWTILAGARSPRDDAYFEARRQLFGGAEPTPESAVQLDGAEASVAVFIPCYGEPVAVIERTALAAKAMIGRHVTYVLDDGRSDEVRDMAARIGVNYLRRLTSGGAKAGNVNHALSQVKTDYFCIFDADFVAEHPEYEDTSIRVVGSYNGTPFTFTSDLTLVQSVSFPAVVEVETEGQLALTLLVNVADWFAAADGGLVDPAQANNGMPLESVVEQQIRESFRAFRDSDADAEGD